MVKLAQPFVGVALFKGCGEALQGCRPRHRAFRSPLSQQPPNSSVHLCKRHSKSGPGICTAPCTLRKTSLIILALPANGTSWANGQKYMKTQRRWVVAPIVLCIKENVDNEGETCLYMCLPQDSDNASWFPWGRCYNYGLFHLRPVVEVGVGRVFVTFFCLKISSSITLAGASAWWQDGGCCRPGNGHCAVLGRRVSTISPLLASWPVRGLSLGACNKAWASHELLLWQNLELLTPSVSV